MRHDAQAAIARSGNSGEFFKCVDAATGAPRWNTRIYRGAAVLAGRTLVIQAESSGLLRLVAADPAAYRELERLPVLKPGASTLTPPAVAGGKIFIRNLEEVVALGITVENAGCGLRTADRGMREKADAQSRDGICAGDGLAAIVAAQSTQNPQSAAVRKTIEDHYFKAHATGEGSALKDTFIDEGKMMWVADGQLRTRPSGEYIAGFPGTPATDEAQRRRRVVMVDVTGDTAVPKVELDYPDMRVIDYFSLLKIGGEWKIVPKTFHREPKTKPAK